MGISIAASTLVGQALGAGDVRLAARAGWRSARLSLLVSLVLFVVFALLRTTLAEGFTDDADVIAALEPFMLLLGIAQPFLGVHFTLAGALRGAGDTVTPLWSATLGNWVFRVPLALLVAKVFHADVVWVWGTVVFDHVTRAIWLTWAFRRERWAQKRRRGSFQNALIERHTSGRRLAMSDPRWKKLLAAEAFAVLFEEATERPGSSALERREAQGHVRVRGVPRCRCSRPTPSTRAAPAGRASTSRSRATSRPSATGSSCCRAPSTTARAAAATRATCSTTARSRPASATATTAWRCCFVPEGEPLPPERKVE